MRCEDGSPALRLVQRGTTTAWPPASVKAHIAWDVWCFGALLFEATCGVSLVDAALTGGASTANGEQQQQQQSWAAMAALADWDGALLHTAMATWHSLVGEDVESSRSAAALLRACLHPEPTQRPASARELFQARFLNPSGGRVPLKAADVAARGYAAAVSGDPIGSRGGSPVAPPELGIDASAIRIGVPRSESSASGGSWDGVPAPLG
jgi:hypothetical protein